MSGHLQSFLQSFQELENQINIYLSNDSVDLKLASEKLQQISRLVSENSASMPSYELLKAQSTVEKHRTRILQLEQSLNPQKKFKFNKKKDNQDTKVTNQMKPDQGKKDTKDARVAKASLSNICDKEVTLESFETSNQDLWFDKLTRCKLTIKGVPTALHLTGLSDCTIVGGPVLTSVFLEECKNSIFVIACHQLRIHKTQNCNFYLHISSHPVIEECSQCNFAPYHRVYDGMEEEFSKANLDMDNNFWYQVDDFNWLSMEEPSPNWKILPEDQRLSLG